MNLKKKMLRYEKTYSKYATKNKKAIRIKNERTNDIRLDFFHDIDRIIHCYSYTRYIENQIRETFGFVGTPLKFIIRERKEND